MDFLFQCGCPFFQCHEKAVTAITFVTVDDKECLVTGSEDRLIQMWSIQNHGEGFVLRLDEFSVPCWISDCVFYHEMFLLFFSLKWMLHAFQHFKLWCPKSMIYKCVPNILKTT